MTVTWTNCYGRSWHGLLSRDAMRHPAKFSRRLLDRIYSHGLGRAYWKPGDLIGDPFGGVACGGVIAVKHGLQWIGVELEPEFVALGAKVLERCADRARLVQGDSRRFAQIVAAECSAIVGSPPHGDSMTQGNRQEKYNHARYGGGGQLGWPQRYGDTPGQIGNLPVGPAGAVTSPPYGPISVEKSSGRIDMASNYRTYRASGGRSTFGSYCATQARHTRGYGASPGQLGELPNGAVDDDEGPETYWSAVRAVYKQCLIAIAPGGVLCVVVKDYVKRGKRVPLGDQTWALLQHVGFEPLERIHASLVHEDRALTGHVIKRVERKSFFRRLAERNGSPRVDHEDVLFVRRAP